MKRRFYIIMLIALFVVPLPFVNVDTSNESRNDIHLVKEQVSNSQSYNNIIVFIQEAIKAVYENKDIAAENNLSNYCAPAICDYLDEKIKIIKLC